MSPKTSSSQFKTTIELKIKDKKGNIKLYKKYEGHSWTVNFAEALRAMLYGNLNVTSWAKLIDTNGTQHTADMCDIDDHRMITAVMALRAPDGDDTWGMVIGSNNTAEDPADTNIKSPIKNSDMHYSSTLISGDVTVAVGGGQNELNFKIWRTFVNNSGQKITVYEVGLIAQYRGIKPGATGLAFKYLIYRHVFDQGIEVDDGDALTITITIHFPL